MVTLLPAHFTCSLLTLASWQEERIYFSLSLSFPCYNIRRLMPPFLLLWRMYEIVDVRNACILFWKLKKFTLMNINFIFTMPKKIQCFQWMKIGNVLFSGVIVWIMTPSPPYPAEIQVLIPRCCECYLTWDFADMIKLCPEVGRLSWIIHMGSKCNVLLSVRLR